MPLELDLDAYHWNPEAFPWIVVGAGLVVLATVVYRRQRASRVALLFSLMMALVVIWFGAFTAMFLSRHSDIALFWARIGVAGVCFLPPAIYDFTTTVLRLSAARRTATVTAWVVAVVFAVATLITPSMIGAMAGHRWGWYPLAGPALSLYLIFFAGLGMAQFAEGLRERSREEDPRRRRRIGKLMLSFLIVYAAIVDFLPMYGVRIRPAGYLAVLTFLLVAWTSIRRHRLQPITVARAADEILHTMADALFVIDTDARIRVMNDAVQLLLGFSRPELMGKSIDTLEESAGDQAISQTFSHLALHGAIRDQERRMLTRDGEAIDVGVSISPLTENEIQQGAIVIARDIRERKRAERELRTFMMRLEQSNRELEDFAYVASHDLQEPLRKIQAFGDLLKSKHSDNLPAQGRDYVDRMQSAARRMQVLINDLLSFSRITTKAQPFERVSMKQVAWDVEHDLETRIHDAHGCVTIGDLPDVTADSLQMRQLMQNLIANALKFHREGVPPIVEVSSEEVAGRVQITVRDNGIGFDPKYAERIFTMFERLHTRGAYEGTGIGLAICRKIAERHEGSIVARSVPGEGSAFIVTLPLFAPATSHPEPRQTSARSGDHE